MCFFNRCLPLNFRKDEIRGIYKDRMKIGANLADVDPMQLDSSVSILKFVLNLRCNFLHLTFILNLKKKFSYQKLKSLYILKTNFGELERWLSLFSIFFALAEDLSLIPNLHMVTHTK